jgi:hypothetical protein
MAKAIQVLMPASGVRRNYAPSKILHVHGILVGTTIDQVDIRVDALDTKNNHQELTLVTVKPLPGYLTFHAKHNLITEPDNNDGRLYVTAVLTDKVSGKQLGPGSVLIVHKLPRGRRMVRKQPRGREGYAKDSFGAWTVIDIPYDGANNVPINFTACGYDDTGDSGMTTTPNVSGTLTDGSSPITRTGDATTLVAGYDWSIPFTVPAGLQNKWLHLTVTQNNASDTVEIWVPS